MTALCGGGASGVKPLAPAAVFLTGEAITAVLTEGLGTAVWADLVVFAASQTITLSTFCTTDPPAVPVFSVQDILDILSPNPFVLLPGQIKLATLIQVAAWYVFCDCTSGAPPTPVVPPTRPAAAPVVNPPSAGQLGTAPCWDVANSFTVPAPAMGSTSVNLTTQFLPGTLVSGMGNPAPLNTAVLIPPGVTSIQIVGDVTCVPQNFATGFFVTLYDASKNPMVGGTTSFNANGGPYNGSRSILAGATYMQCSSQNSATNGPVNGHFEVSFFCSPGGSSVPNTPCCPPDPTLLGAIAQIEGMLEAIYRALPSAVSSYAEDLVHAGLHGSGTVLLGPGAIAIKVTITADNSSLGSLAGDPTYLLNRGYIVPIAVEGPIRGQTRLVYNPQLYQLPPLTDSIGYQLGTGVTVSITELVRGP